MPCPNDTWWVGERVMSSRSGSAHRAGSRLAAPTSIKAAEPADTGSVPMLASVSAIRAVS